MGKTGKHPYLRSLLLLHLLLMIYSLSRVLSKTAAGQPFSACPSACAMAASSPCWGRTPSAGRDHRLSHQKLLALWFNGFTGFSAIPLKISACADFFAIGVPARKLLHPKIPVGYASTTIVLLGLGGLLLMILELLGEYVERLLITMNNIPPYVVKEVRRSNEHHAEQA